MPERSYRVLLWTLALVGLVADQASKYGVFGGLYKVEEDFDGSRFVKARPFAVFQTQPESRFFSPMADHGQAADVRGFFLEANFEDRLDEQGRPVPHVNHGALFGFMQDKKRGANWTFA